MLNRFNRAFDVSFWRCAKYSLPIWIESPNNFDSHCLVTTRSKAREN